MTQLAEPAIRPFTRAEYYKMADLGFFDQQRVELIAGEVIRMSPQTNPHAVAIMIINRWLTKSLDESLSVRVQLPLAVDDLSEPEPDFAVVPRSAECGSDHPSSALLVIEIALTSLRHDRRKAHLYAAGRVSEYWIINLPSRKLEVYRDPVPDASAEFGHRCAHQATLSPDQSIQPSAIHIPAVIVSSLFPPQPNP